MFISVQSENRTNAAKVWRVNVGTSLPHNVFEEVETIVCERNEVRADVVRRLLLRGLEAFRRDGALDEPMDLDECQRQIAC